MSRNHAHGGRGRRTLAAVADTVLVEFTVEPFAEGAPGVHVLAAIDAARALGCEPAMGPFATSVTVARARAAELADVIVAAALGAGATRVNLTVEQS